PPKTPYPRYPEHQGDLHRGLKTREAGRETGPECSQKQKWWSPAHRRRGVPLAAQRGARDTLRKPSIIATSIGARLWSFSRLTSVSTDPSSEATYLGGTRLSGNTRTSSRPTSQDR